MSSPNWVFVKGNSEKLRIYFLKIGGKNQITIPKKITARIHRFIAIAPIKLNNIQFLPNNTNPVSEMQAAPIDSGCHQSDGRITPRKLNIAATKPTADRIQKMLLKTLSTSSFGVGIIQEWAGIQNPRM